MALTEEMFANLGLDMEEAEERALRITGRKYCKTFMKEMIGEKLIDKNDVWQVFCDKILHQEFKTVVKVDDKERQLRGIDYIVNGVNIDIKCCIGSDYTKCPLEISQNGKSSAANKDTEWFLYLLIDPNHIWFCAIPFKDYLQFIQNATETHTSFNGSGIYCKKFIRPFQSLEHQ